MEISRFLSEVINAVAWPVTVITLVLMLKKPILALLPNLQHLKYKDFELKFSEEIKALKNEASKTKNKKHNDGVMYSLEDSPLERLASYSPRAAIMEAWGRVEAAAAAVAGKYDLDKLSVNNMVGLGECLYQDKFIDKKQLNIFNKLHQLRNKAVHANEFELNITDAIFYVELASTLENQIKPA